MFGKDKYMFLQHSVQWGLQKYYEAVVRQTTHCCFVFQDSFWAINVSRIDQSPDI